jgi:predicted Ser/Thr protein kinase
LTDADPTEVGGYRLRARLGAGGMGSVCLSFTPGGRAVAIKVVRPEYADDTDFRLRFRQEVANAQRVNGFYTAQVTDAQVPWLAGAYVAGPSLAEAVRDNGPLAPATVKALTAAVAESLQAVHAAGIVHRDLKPSNVVLAADGPRVIDFGIARAADATPLTQSGYRIGSPQYTAPEQALGTSVQSATDVFALGALAFLASTGRSPFGEGNDLGMLYRVINEEPGLSGCPEEIRDLMARCLAKDPQDRPSPAEIIGLCGTDTADGTRRIGPGWLPEGVTAVISAREAGLHAIHTAPTVGGPAYSPTTPVSADPVSADPMTAPMTAPPPQAGPPAVAPSSTPPARWGKGLKVALIFSGALLLAGGGATAAVFLTGQDGKEAQTQSTGAARTPDTPSTAAPDASVPSPVSPAGPSDDGAADASESADLTDAAAPAASVPEEDENAIQWRGDIRIDESGMDLDTVPVTHGTPFRNDVGLDDLDSVAELRSFNSHDLMVRKGTAMPTRAQCMDLVATQGMEDLEVVKGDIFCVATDEGRTAVLTVKSVGDDMSTGLMAEATVWAAGDNLDRQPRPAVVGTPRGQEGGPGAGDGPAAASRRPVTKGSGTAGVALARAAGAGVVGRTPTPGPPLPAPACHGTAAPARRFLSHRLGRCRPPPRVTWLCLRPPSRRT